MSNSKREPSTSITQLVKTVAFEEVDKCVSPEFKNIYERLSRLESRLRAHINQAPAPIDINKHLSDIKNDLDFVGGPWGQAEEKQLNAELKIAFASIARNHGRTKVAIISRVDKKKLIQNLYC